MRRSFTFLSSVGFLALVTTAAHAAPVHVVRYEDDGKGRLQVIDKKEQDLNGVDEVVVETSHPQFIAEHAKLGKARIVTLKSQDPKAVDALLAQRGVLPAAKRSKDASADELVTLVASGPSENRIDLVFMGDGYTAAEREKFFADINRIVHDMFVGNTFNSYLPLFNVHAVFRASNQSGIGRGTSQDTAYKLYREGQTLRAIYPGDMASLRESWAVAPDCDYPIVIANDPHYGGLGGEVAISTSSETSGTVVLRHELGHNFGQVGEEYDGGGYFGANQSSSLDVSWAHWLSNTETPLAAEPSQARNVSWPWHNLSQGAYTASFRSDGRWASTAIRFSASGMPDRRAMNVTLDGQPIDYADAGSDDRTFYDVNLDRGFTDGNHALKFEETVHDGNNWVSSMTIHEYASDYNFDPDHIGAYPLFTPSGQVDGYRSNHETCLMRNMQSPVFCKVCQENNWLEFFGKVKLIDGVGVGRGTDAISVRLATQQLGQFRQSRAAFAESLVIKWFKDGEEVPALANQAEWSLPTRDAQGSWEARVEFVTPEVRKDTRGLLKDRLTIRI